MNTILLVILGYILAKWQYSDPLMFKIGIVVVLVLAVANYLGELAVKIVFRLLAERTK